MLNRIRRLKYFEDVLNLSLIQSKSIYSFLMHLGIIKCKITIHPNEDYSMFYPILKIWWSRRSDA